MHVTLRRKPEKGKYIFGQRGPAGSMDKYVVIGVALQKWEAGSSRTWKRICDNAVDADREGSAANVGNSPAELKMACDASLTPMLTAVGLCLACMMKLEKMIFSLGNTDAFK